MKLNFEFLHLKKISSHLKVFSVCITEYGNTALVEIQMIVGCTAQNAAFKNQPKTSCTIKTIFTEYY